MSRRAIFEALKYLTTRDVFAGAVLVNYEWSCAAYSEEILLTLLAREKEEPENRGLPLYQRLKKVSKSVSYLVHVDDGFLLAWHLTTPSSSPASLNHPSFSRSSRYILSSHFTVLITGGIKSHTSCVSLHLLSMEITPFPPLLRPHAKHGIAVLKDAVYVSGGDISHSFVCYAEVYRGEEWREIADMTVERYNHTLCAYGEKVYAFGGSNATGYQDSIEYYSEEKWNSAPMSLPTSMNFPAVFPSKEGLILVSGYSPYTKRHLVHFWDGTNWQEICETTISYSLSNAISVRQGVMYIYCHTLRRDSLPLVWERGEGCRQRQKQGKKMGSCQRKRSCNLI